MDRRQLRELGQTFAYVMGDLRDWPVRCCWPDCYSENVHMDHAHYWLRCYDCHRLTSPHIAREDRERRARSAIESGVGGPALQCYEYARSPEGQRKQKQYLIQRLHKDLVCMLHNTENHD